LQTTVIGPGRLTFRWKVSSEPGYDFLTFFVNAAARASISGETDWQQMSFDIPHGEHTLKWVYSKDGSVSAGRDAGWVDEVTFTQNSNHLHTGVSQRLDTPVLLEDNTVVLFWRDVDEGSLSAEALAGFKVQASTNLVDWVTLSQPLTLTNGSVWLQETNGAVHPMRFYRLVEE
jgi:hypothetical protein